ncbi:hypothetical protein VNO80_14567 [Phaseolus coccineus]|uniref:Uncharacterized protein n=1 Tax=Phaseolus coccineus TaxID=3886 RepID=A0AAN9MPQ3_PHACN
MMKEPMTCNRNSEDCLRLFGVNIVAKKPITVPHTQSLSMENLSYCHGEKELNGGKNCKDEHLSEDFDQQLHTYHDNSNMGKPWTEEEHRKKMQLQQFLQSPKYKSNHICITSNF